MALVVEDGTAKANSNAYDTAANANSYYTDMGYSDTATDATMIRGSRTLDAMFREWFKGFKTTSGQAMAWPRNGVHDEDGNTIASDTIPDALKYAAYELARVVPTDQAVDAAKLLKSVKAGSVTIDFAGSLRVRSVLSLAQDYLAPYMSARRRLVRA